MDPIKERVGVTDNNSQKKTKQNERSGKERGNRKIDQTFILFFIFLINYE